MDGTSTSAEKMSPEQSVREYIRQHPFKVSPWVIRDFFGNALNVTEEQLDYSIDALAAKEPNFTEDNRELLQELEKWALMMVPMIKEIPLSVLLQVIEEFQKSTKILPLLPGYPKSPATKILDYIFPDNSLSAEEKALEYKEIAKNTNRLLKYVRSWRDNVASYIQGLETFFNGYEDLSEEQQLHVESLMGRSRKLIPQIDKRIEAMLQNKEGAEEREEFEKFYKVLVKDQKYKDLEPSVARSQIQVIYDESDHVVRTIVAGTAVVVKEEAPEEAPEEAEVPEEEMEQEQVYSKPSRKRQSNGNDLSVSPNHLPRTRSKSQSPVKKSKTAEFSNQHQQHQHHRTDERVSVLRSDD
ncbi:unnamed protein product [Caenorhabditis brenneri]